MKKNFFKKLSFVLAFAMVLSVLAPASGVFAAKAPKLNAKSKYLHLAVDSEYGANKFDFNISNKGKGWKYAWTSSNKKVATVNAKNGVTTAKGAGTATITVKITDKDGKKVENLKAKVTVRDNISEVFIKNPLKDGETLGVNEEYDFDRTYVTEANLKKGSKAITRWTVEQEGDVKTATIDNSGVFVAEAAGEYEVIARSFQSKAKYNAWLEDAEANADFVTATSEAVKVVVVASMVDVVQEDLSSVKVTFDSPMTDEDMKNVSLYSLVGKTEVKQTIKEIKLDDSKTVATITVYVPFTEGSTYVVKYPEVEAVSFDAAKAGAEDVVSMTIETPEVVVAKPTELKVKLYNEAGVDITKSALVERVRFEGTSEKAHILAGNELTIFNRGDVVTVKATFHSYKYDSSTGQEIENIVTARDILGVDEATVAVGGLDAYTIVKNNAPNFDDPKYDVTAEETGLRLYVKVKKSDNSAITSDDDYESTKFDFESSDPSVLIVDQLGNLHPIKVGSAVIVVKYNNVPIDSVTVVVKPKRAATILDLGTYAFSLSNSTLLSDGDRKEITVKVKDQLGDDVVVEELSIEKLSGPADNEVASIEGTKVVFTANGKAIGSYSYKVTANGLSRVVTIVVSAPSADYIVKSYKIELDSTSYDTAVKNDDMTENVSVKLFGYAANGVKLVDLTEEEGYRLAITGPKATDSIETVTGGSFALVTSASGTAIASASGSAIQKKTAGTYKVTAYKTADNGTETAIDSKYFTVKDTQLAPKFEVKSRVFTYDAVGDAAIKDAVKEAFKITLDGADISDSIISVSSRGSSTQLSITSVTVRQTFTNGSYIDHEVKIGLTINKK